MQWIEQWKHVGNRKPPPHPENLRSWKPGQSGNPAGTTRSRRITSAIEHLLDDKNLAPDAAAVLYAMATGQKAILNGREPNLDWFDRMLELLGERGLSALIAAQSSDNINSFRSHIDSIKHPRRRGRKHR